MIYIAIHDGKNMDLGVQIPYQPMYILEIDVELDICMNFQ